MRAAFTLVELLVVITVIVVLLALLAPALDKAIYQAELAVCGGNMRGAAGGVLLYAFDHKRSYPARPGVTAAGWTAQMIKLGRSHINSGTGGVWDDRPGLAGYLDLNGSFNDPLGESVDLEVDDVLTTIFVSYSMWFNFRWRDGFPPGSRGMSKVGDKITFVNDAFYTPPRQFRLSLLLGDRDISAPPTYANGSHPDSDGMMVNYVMDNEPVNRGNQDAFVRSLEMLNGNVTESNWIVNPGLRGAVDTNHAYDDGSVRRIDRVAYGFSIDADERITFLPEENLRFVWPSYRAQVPKD